MAGAEAERGSTAVEVLEVCRGEKVLAVLFTHRRLGASRTVVGIGDGEMAGILITVGVAVADQRGLPVVMDVTVGDGDPVAAVCHVDETIVVVLVVILVTGHIDVVDPDVLRGLDGDGVTVVGQNLGDLEVPDNDVGLLVDGEADTGEA